MEAESFARLNKFIARGNNKSTYIRSSKEIDDQCMIDPKQNSSKTSSEAPKNDLESNGIDIEIIVQHYSKSHLMIAWFVSDIIFISFNINRFKSNPRLKIWNISTTRVNINIPPREIPKIESIWMALNIEQIQATSPYELVFVRRWWSFHM